MKLKEILASVWKVVVGEEEESFLLSKMFKLLLTCVSNHPNTYTINVFYHVSFCSISISSFLLILS